MNNTIQYRDYVGSVEFSEEDGISYGKVMGIRSLISYEGENAKELINDFHAAVDDYLAMCEAEGRKPEVAYKGSFNIRISPELHKRLHRAIIGQKVNPSHSPYRTPAPPAGRGAAPSWRSPAPASAYGRPGWRQSFPYRRMGRAWW